MIQQQAFNHSGIIIPIERSQSGCSLIWVSVIRIRISNNLALKYKPLANEKKILDSGDAVARQVHRILLSRNELAIEKEAQMSFFTTGDSVKVEQVFHQLLHKNVKVTHVTL